MAERKARPDADSATVAPVYEDMVLPCLREVVVRGPFHFNQYWVEPPAGYMWPPAAGYECTGRLLADGFPVMIEEIFTMEGQTPFHGVCGQK